MPTSSPITYEEWKTELYRDRGRLFRSVKEEIAHSGRVGGPVPLSYVNPRGSPAAQKPKK